MEATHCRKLVFLSLLVVIGFLSMYFVESNHQVDVSLSVQNRDEFLSLLTLNGTFVPEGWTGLPLSFNNKLYKDPKENPLLCNETLQALIKKLNGTSMLTLLQKDDFWEDVAASNEKIIGWNGIFDAVDYVTKKRNLQINDRLHKLGELLYAHSDKENPRHLVEITSRNILSKAPMHGSVWAAINDKGTLKTNELIDLVYNEFCYFREYEDMGNLWISCVHGFGHGLAKTYGMNEVDKGLEICASSEDMQFQYACATGIYMDLQDWDYQNKFTPCDQYRFPGACYRFKSMLFNSLSPKEESCTTQVDDHHKLGCIWGKSYLEMKSGVRYFEVCQEYLPDASETDLYSQQHYFHAACLDGFLSARPIYQPGRINPRLCEDLASYPLSYKVCNYRKRVNMQKFTLSQDYKFYFYNAEILEKYFKRGENIVESAKWKEDWKLKPQILPAAIPPKLTNPPKIK